MRRARLGLVGFALLALGGQQRCPAFLEDPADPMLHFDLADPVSGELLEMTPGGRWVLAGPDGRLGTDDDEIVPFWSGDVDLVVRTGMQGFAGAIPDPAALGPGAWPEAVAEPFAEGTPLDFVVTASDGAISVPYGRPVAPPSLPDGAPLLAVAFGDLDGDGFIGVTLRDGDAGDAGVEEAELVPVGRRFALAQGGRGGGSLFVEAGGPPGAELALAVGAAAYAGPFDAGHFGGSVPDGPLVMTKLPFHPETDPDDVVDGNLPGAASPDALTGVQIEPAIVPEPGLASVRESWTVLLDGSDGSVDVGRSHSGGFERVGLGALPDAAYQPLPSRPLRPGLDAAGGRAVYEVLQHLALADDGAATQRTLRLLPLDRLGNVAALPAPTEVTVRAVGDVRITAPDGDGDPSVETFDVVDARGLALVVDDAGGTWDDADAALEVEGAVGLFRLDVTLPDPDVDDSGLVDGADVAAVEALDGLRAGEPGFVRAFDLDGDGRIRDDDADIVRAALGLALPTP